MSQINDRIIEVLGRGQVNDLLLRYYQENGATSDDINDATREWLELVQPISGSINDMWYSYLTQEGYTGTLADMKLAFWIAQSDFIFEVVTFLGEDVTFNGVLVTHPFGPGGIPLENLVFLSEDGVTDSIGELSYMINRYPSNQNHSVQQVKGSGFAGAADKYGIIKTLAGVTSPVSLPATAWEKPLSIRYRQTSNTTYTVLVGGGTSGNVDEVYLMTNRVSAGNIACACYVGATQKTIIQGGTGLNDGSEHLVEVFYDGSVASLYVDGDLIGTSTWNLDGNQTIGTVGARPSTAGKFDGEFFDLNLPTGERFAMGCVGSAAEYAISDHDLCIVWNADPIVGFTDGFGFDTNADGISLRSNELAISTLSDGTLSNTSGNAVIIGDELTVDDADFVSFLVGNEAIGDTFHFSFDLTPGSAPSIKIASADGGNGNFTTLFPAISKRVNFLYSSRFVDTNGVFRIRGFSSLETTGISNIQISKNTAILPDIDTIVCFGDSITHGELWVTYVDQALPDTTVINSGITGDETADLIARFATDVAAYSPTRVHVLVGINDILHNIALETTLSNLDTIRDLIVGIGAIPDFSLLLPFGEYMVGETPAWTQARQDKHDAINAHILMMGVNVIDNKTYYSDGINYISGFSDDGLHPNTLSSPIIGLNYIDSLVTYQDFIETTGVAITGQQPAGVFSVTQYPGPLGADMQIISGNDFSDYVLKPPLGPVFQSLYPAEATIDLSTHVDTAKSRWGTTGGVEYIVDQTDLDKIDRYIGNT